MGEKLNTEPSKKLYSVLAQWSAEAALAGDLHVVQAADVCWSLVLETCPPSAPHTQQKAWRFSFEPRMAAELWEQWPPCTTILELNVLCYKNTQPCLRVMHQRKQPARLPVASSVVTCLFTTAGRRWLKINVVLYCCSVSSPSCHHDSFRAGARLAVCLAARWLCCAGCAPAPFPTGPGMVALVAWVVAVLFLVLSWVSLQVLSKCLLRRPLSEGLVPCGNRELDSMNLGGFFPTQDIL